MCSVLLFYSDLDCNDSLSNSFHHSGYICARCIWQGGFTAVCPSTDVRFHWVYTTGVDADQHLQQTHIVEEIQVRDKTVQKTKMCPSSDGEIHTVYLRLFFFYFSHIHNRHHVVFNVILWSVNHC